MLAIFLVDCLKDGIAAGTRRDDLAGFCRFQVADSIFLLKNFLQNVLEHALESVQIEFTRSRLNANLVFASPTGQQGTVRC